jgi:hypothetical protein
MHQKKEGGFAAVSVDLPLQLSLSSLIVLLTRNGDLVDACQRQFD